MRNFRCFFFFQPRVSNVQRKKRRPEKFLRGPFGSCWGDDGSLWRGAGSTPDPHIPKFWLWGGLFYGWRGGGCAPFRAQGKEALPERRKNPADAPTAAPTPSSREKKKKKVTQFQLNFGVFQPPRACETEGISSGSAGFSALPTFTVKPRLERREKSGGEIPTRRQTPAAPYADGTSSAFKPARSAKALREANLGG